jgi:transcriptional antiterminator NusG
MAINWYILYTEANAEKKVAALLTKKKIQNYCPLNIFVDPKNSRKKILKPLFKSFVFVNIDPERLFQIKHLKGIRSIVYWLNEPAQVTNEEILVIDELLQTYKSLQLEKVPVNIKDETELINDSYIGIKSNTPYLCEKIKKTLLPSLGYALITYFEECKLKANENVIIINEKDTIPIEIVFE